MPRRLFDGKQQDEDGRLDTTAMPEELVKLVVGVMGYAAEMELKSIESAEGREVAESRESNWSETPYAPQQAAVMEMQKVMGTAPSPTMR